MKPPTVVKDLYVFEDHLLCLFTRLEPRGIHQLSLQGTEERFHHRVIITISLPAHTLCDFLTLQQFPELAAGVLATPVRVKDQTLPPGIGHSLQDGSLTGINHQLTFKASVHRPAYDLSVEKVHHYREV